MKTPIIIENPYFFGYSFCNVSILLSTIFTVINSCDG